MKDFVDFFDVYNAEHIRALDYYLKNNFVWKEYKNFIPEDVNLPTINDLRVIHEKMAQAWMEKILKNYVNKGEYIQDECTKCVNGKNYSMMSPIAIIDKQADEYLIRFECGAEYCGRITEVKLSRFYILSNDYLYKRLQVLGAI